MSTKARSRGMLATAVVVALVVTAFAGASQAQASTIYACVKKNGSARIYGKKPKCKKGEKLVSWGTTGAAGKNGSNGTNGTNGTNGANGAVGGFSATATEVEFTANKEEKSPKTIVSKTLPAGQFIVSASLNLDASGSEAELEYGVECKLLDTPSGGGAPTSDVAFLDGSLDFDFLGGHSSFTSVSLGLAVTSPSQTSTIALECANLLSSANAKLRANNATILAVQTTANS